MFEPKKYRKKPVVIEAMLYDGSVGSLDAIFQWLGGDYGVKAELKENHGGERNVLCIDTLEGAMDAQIGDYIIKGVKDEFYPCKPDIFGATYEAVEVAV